MRMICALTILLIYSCGTEISTSPDYNIIPPSNDYSDTLARRYPYFDVQFSQFDFYTPNSGVSTISVAEKGVMLQKLAIVRFVVNTPEFEEAILKRTFYSANNASGPYGTVKVGDKLDSKRLLDVIRAYAKGVKILKQDITSGAVAVGAVGEHLYVKNYHDEINKKFTGGPLAVAFPASENWNSGWYLNDRYSRFVFHELLHNAGFSHGNTEVVYPLQYMYEAVWDDPNFQKKYKKELSEFKYFYVSKYSSLLNSPTIKSSRRISASARASVSPSDDIMKNEVVCVLYDEENCVTITNAN